MCIVYVDYIVLASLFFRSRKRSHFLTVISQIGSDLRLIKNLRQSANTMVILLGSCKHCGQCRFDSRCGLKPENSVWKYPRVLKVINSFSNWNTKHNVH